MQKSGVRAFIWAVNAIGIGNIFLNETLFTKYFTFMNVQVVVCIDEYENNIFSDTLYSIYFKSNRK